MGERIMPKVLNSLNDDDYIDIKTAIHNVKEGPGMMFRGTKVTVAIAIQMLRFMEQERKNHGRQFYDVELKKFRDFKDNEGKGWKPKIEV